MWKTIFAGLLTICLGAPPAFAAEGNYNTFLIHAKTSLKIDDAQICVVSQRGEGGPAEGP